MRDPVDQEVDHRSGDGREREARPGRTGALALALLRRPRDTLAGAAGIAACATIVINALFMQPGPHPAPIFALKTEKPRAAPAREQTGALSVLPRPRPADAQAPARVEPAAAAAAKPAVKARPELVTDIQRELLRRGYYDAAVDGIAGSRTEAAIREFEQAQGLAPTGEPTDAILKSIMRSPAKPKPAAAPPRPDPIAGLIGGSATATHAPVVQARATTGASPTPTPLAAHPVAPVKAAALAAPPPAPTPPQPVAQPRATSPATAAGTAQIKAVQRALADYGYGQVRQTGVHDKATHDAIAAFEEARRMPVTGQVSDRLVRELVALTGRPIE
ncbi:peptidoglycan hydrolase-like protein with peptidoglycan-binding domain [Rhodoplanes tepidamans]|uniref:Peptidoglycan-binding domain-containing protein n=3 Tax=Rhodoplanes TaxID=29407 RepID=A0ABT5JBR1_RHOTP|nr:peptidoglycan-binding domain-containing protein [Rhodoplanes tepidamans]MDC7787047.1 peptidoglycan-binding domain-containing protein [Rhodoplanes tepidamans]MDQ0359065.1 peptidoglycan hydrolase-like protein with peptidoglycan-binding domain [Rhodoplanes tepidamans]